VRSGFFFDLAWVPGGLYSVRSTEPTDLEAAGLVMIKPDERAVLVPLEGDCNVSFLVGINALPDGRIGYENECLVPSADARATWTYLGTYDPATDDAEISGMLPLSVTNIDVTQSLDRVLGQLGGGRCGYLVTLDRGRIKPLPVLISSAGVEWRNGWPDQAPDGDSNGAPAAVLPDISPDGATVAFLAAPSGDERVWGLHVAPLRGPASTEIAGGFGDPAAVQWSPDGRTIAVVAELDDEERAIWLVDVSSGSVQLLARYANDVVWSPSGDQLAALIDPQPTELNSLKPMDIVIYDRPAVSDDPG
jgi:hypothetical protein